MCLRLCTSDIQWLCFGNLELVIWLQGVLRGQKHPLVVHACTSSQNALSTGKFFQHIQAHFTAHPPPFRVILGAYPKYQGLNIVRNRQMLAARSALAEAKFVALCAALRLAGRDRLARKLLAGWKVSGVPVCFMWNLTADG